jgi:hypothetical protein
VSPNAAKNARRRVKCRASMGVLLLDRAVAPDFSGGLATPQL